MKRQPLVPTSALWTRRAIAHAGINQAELSRKLAEELGISEDRSIVNKIVNGSRALSAEEMLAIETITAYPIPSPSIATKVPLLDWISAGRLSAPRSQIPVEDVPLLAFADLGKGEFFALRVTGSSMDRVSPEGSVIVVDKSDREPANGKCYVFSLRGETTYKMWQAGPPDYLLPYSHDPVHKPIFPKRKGDLEVVGRVKRSVLDL